MPSARNSPSIGRDPLPTLSVVMPTFNRAQTLTHSVEPLLTAGQVLEVIVVDDGSTDDTRAILDQLSDRYPALRAISVENGGAARARQVGVERARGEVVLIMDDDVVAAPDLALGHARRHADRTGLLVVGYMPTIVPERWMRGMFATTIYSEYYEEHCDEWESDPLSLLRKLWMGNVSLRRADALRIGMSSTVSGYHADRDFGVRCERAGMNAVFDRSLRATHRHQRNLTSFRADARSQGASNFELYDAHSDILGPFEDRYSRHRRRLGNELIKSVRFKHAYVVARTSISAVVWVAGVLRARRLEIRAAKLLNRIEGQRGYIDRSRTVNATR